MGRKLTCGIDEAGRGPALGPLVLAAVWLDGRAARALRRAGVRDSKDFGAGEAARAERARLAEIVRRRAAHVACEAVPPREIDRRVLRGELDALEREVALRLCQGGPPAARVIADGRLFAPLRARLPRLRAETRADARYTAVAAASIVAKDLRDRLFLEGAARHGDLAEACVKGLGYANSATRAFLRVYAARHGRLPPETRLAWGWDALREALGRDPRDDLRDEATQLLLF